MSKASTLNHSIKLPHGCYSQASEAAAKRGIPVDQFVSDLILRGAKHPSYNPLAILKPSAYERYLVDLETQDLAAKAS